MLEATTPASAHLAPSSSRDEQAAMRLPQLVPAFTRLLISSGRIADIIS